MVTVVSVHISEMKQLNTGTNHVISISVVNEGLTAPPAGLEQHRH